ncbi:hypothetical protein BRADI_1g38455v3 [Brachypodium distachyon]|uniref:Uncharacterized protein n=1 Tax=Brachypodium distachyon TaxID=15368 RepID=A0A2K2DNG4_BRADI|nr:hypothetical protein BRADI_1g38455v3 [Brachypodium distachyon]
MDSLINWDFSYGERVSSQVRRCFNSSVGFGGNPSSREFFLVVSFKTFAFPLDVDSVSVALQSCLGV